MRKFIAIAVISAVLLILTACGREAAYVPNNTQYPEYQPRVTPEPTKDEDTSPLQSTFVAEEELIIQITTATDEFINGFDRVHKLDYGVVRTARGDDHTTIELDTGLSLMIWINQPVTDFEVLLLGHDIINDQLIYIPIESFGLVSELPPTEAFVITSYAGNGTMPWSGVTFIDENGIKRYFWMQQNQGYPQYGDFWFIREFENKNGQLPEGWRPDRMGAQFAELTAILGWELGLAMSNAELNAAEPSPPWRDIVLADSGISDYGWQVAADFLMEFTSIFTRVGRREYVWDSGRNVTVPTGRFMLGWDPITHQAITTDEAPEIYFAQISGSPYAFFDRHGNAVTGAPWVYAQRFESFWGGEYHVSYSHHYANYFMLFDFDSIGIPDIIVHFQQTFEGCYGGFYRIFRYANGAYHMMEMTAFSSGEQLEWVSFGTTHELFLDEGGRIIVFTNNEMTGSGYDHLVLTGSRAEFHHIEMPNHTWEEWHDYHWTEWEHTPYASNMVASWRDSNPIIFGTDIALTPLYPFEDLGVELYMYASYFRVR